MESLNAYFNEYYEVIYGTLAMILGFGFVRMILTLTKPIKSAFKRHFINKFDE